ncbi:hypothetical protein N8I74_18610 [Chitiniphilus purpureus]|uniref:DUF6916 domain-containing protein n=1 Tax=Chitiniphilus purpureus TaxID=2981137 RepID=A0ABY6DLS5_9NEIS|nr:hypothetical protein [Chitiniphilus sp. CD1]UXY15301.1 hypothetical protein N8I74_18610 [Chitiniphilus sp. CD1]
MSDIPSQDELQQALGQTWRVSWEGHPGIDVDLVEVNQGKSMNSRYHCYDAVFRQPAGFDLPQYSYTLHGPDASSWWVMLTPIGPDEEGHRLLQAVFHVRLPVPASP